MEEAGDASVETKALQGRPRYFTPREVAAHNLPTDCWVSINYRVLDISSLIKDNPGPLTQPLVIHAGENISHWFDSETEDIKHHVDPERNLSLPFLPYGPFLHVPPLEPTTQWRTAEFLPWWRDPRYVIGRLTKKARWLELVNVLTQQQHALEVCCEETLAEIQTRYLRVNAHAGSYTWKHLDDDEFVPLQMQRTLEENGIPDESPLFERFDMDEHQYKPTLHLYFDDDLTIIITGLLGQIAAVASHAFDILRELKDETAEVKERMARLHHRVDILAQVIERQDEGATKLLPSQEETDRVLCVQTISAVFSTSASADHQRPGAITAAYNQCEAIPPLEMLDVFYDTDSQRSPEDLRIGLEPHTAGSGALASSISRKKYSHPGFFAEEWLKNETERQQRALELKEERRRERREEHSLRKAHELQQQQRGVVESTGNAAVSEDPEQKLKFLTIRSWREIYGTGEGKELARQQQQLRIGDRIPSLRDLRKKTRQSVSSIGEDPTLVDGSQQPPPPPPSLPTRPDGPTHDRHCSFSTEQSGPSSSAVLQPTVSPRGAFMQEMDDDEITMEMEEPFTNGVPPPPPPPPLPDATRPDEFTDHGLSYYYDPAASLGLVPPPPPPPPPPTELDEPRASETDEYFDAHDPSDDETPPPPPPPPMDEMEPPPPPPPPPPSESWRPSNLLEEIQLGASLRSVRETRRQREAPTKTLSPQAALLQQILQKQSRPLRPVESRRPSIQPRTSAAPFADSIARILERRSMIAYDSDSAESSKSSGGDDDW